MNHYRLETKAHDALSTRAYDLLTTLDPLTCSRTEIHDDLYDPLTNPKVCLLIFSFCKQSVK